MQIAIIKIKQAELAAYFRQKEIEETTDFYSCMMEIIDICEKRNDLQICAEDCEDNLTVSMCKYEGLRSIANLGVSSKQLQPECITTKSILD